MWTSGLARSESLIENPKSSSSIPIPLNEVLDDTPEVRHKFIKTQENIASLTNQLRAIIKASALVHQTAEAHSAAMRQFSSLLLQFTDSQDAELCEGMSRFGQALQELESFRIVLMNQLETGFVQPIQKFYVEDLQSLKDAERKVERTRANYESSLQRLSQTKRKDSVKSSELAMEVNDMRRAHQLSCLDLAYRLNELQSKKKIEFLERMAAMMFAQLAFYQQGSTYLRDMEPYLRDLTNRIHSTRKELEQQNREQLERKEALEQITVGTKPPRKEANATEMQGYLWMKKTKTDEKWKRRYFVLKDHRMFYYKSENDPSIKVEINVAVSSVRPLVAENDRRYAFEIVNPMQSYLLQAESDEEVVDWITVINNVSQKLLTTQRVTKESKGTNTGSDDSPLALVRKADPANSFCADCGAKVIYKPTWVCTNLGCVICIDCCGIHRSLGTHISKVRSLTLDSWESSMLGVVLGLGNTKANSVLEANLQGVTKPRPESDRLAREKYIRCKYELKLFVPPFRPPPPSASYNLSSCLLGPDLTEKLLAISQGADPNFIPEGTNCRTLLHIAVQKAVPLHVIEFLILNGANVNAIDSCSWTPLHFAAFKDLPLHCSLLYRRGASLEPKDYQGMTPLDVAIQHQQADAVTILRLCKLAAEEDSREVEQHRESSFLTAILNFVPSK